MVQALFKPQTENLLQHLYSLLLTKCFKDADRLLYNPNGGWMVQLERQTGNTLKTGGCYWSCHI
jgi:hypothetical protein